MTLFITNGTIVTAAETLKANIIIEGDKIAAITSDHNIPAGADVIDASGKLVLPGGVDVHTHFDLPMFNTISADDHYTGHKAAAFGGTTTTIDFIPLEKPSLRENIDAWHAKADAKAAVDFSFHMNITRWNKAIEKELSILASEGITSLKVFSAYPAMRLQDGEIFEVLRAAKSHGLLTMLHAEGGDVIDRLVPEALHAGKTSPEWHARTRPAWGAVEATLRGSALAAQADAPLYIVHMNAGGEVDQLHYAREHGASIMGETCPQYLFFSIDDLKRPDGAKWVCSPPVRSKQDNQRLMRGLIDGTLQVLSTDHCSFFYDGTKPITYEGKAVSIPGKELGKTDFSKIPNGLPGVGDRMPVFWTYAVHSGKISANQFVALTCTNPAKIFGLYPKKGTIMPGSDADIVLWDTDRKVNYGVAVAQHRTDYNLYEGMELTGFPEKVFLRGKVIVDDGQWLGRPGMGIYLYRQSHAPLL